MHFTFDEVCKDYTYMKKYPEIETIYGPLNQSTRSLQLQITSDYSSYVLSLYLISTCRPFPFPTVGLALCVHVILNVWVVGVALRREADKIRLLIEECIVGRVDVVFVAKCK